MNSEEQIHTLHTLLQDAVAAANDLRCFREGTTRYIEAEALLRSVESRMDRLVRPPKIEVCNAK
jgi:hypothetical protein